MALMALEYLTVRYRVARLPFPSSREECRPPALLTGAVFRPPIIHAVMSYHHGLDCSFVFIVFPYAFYASHFIICIIEENRASRPLCRPSRLKLPDVIRVSTVGNAGID